MDKPRAPDGLSARVVTAVAVAFLVVVVGAMAVAGWGWASRARLGLRRVEPRPFPKPAPAPSNRTGSYWVPEPSIDGRFALYEDTVWVGEGGNRYQDAKLYFWDPPSSELIRLSDHADPSVAGVVAHGGTVVVFVEQRDPGTKRDGVNPDRTMKRVVRWERATGVSVPLTDFAYPTVAGLGTSDDGSTVAFLGDADAYVIDASGTIADVTHPSIDRSEGYGYGRDRSVSLSADGRTVAYTNLRGPGDVFVHDRISGSTTALADRVRGAGGLRLAFSSHPSLCADGSRLAVTGGTRVGGGGGHDEHQTTAQAMVIDVATGKIVARSRRGVRRGVESEFAEGVVLSPDCRRFAYVAPGKFDGRDFDGNELFKDDVVVVADAISGDAIAVVRTRRGVVGFATRPDGGEVLVLEDGSTASVPR